MGKTSFRSQYFHLLQQYTFPELEKLASDNLVEWNEQGLIVTQTGRNFIRNICSAFDLHYLKKEKVSTQPMYSKAI